MTSSAHIKRYICREFMPGSKTDDLPADLDLLENGILDSLAVLKIVAYIENTYDILLEPEELDPDGFHSVEAISTLIETARMKKRELAAEVSSGNIGL